MNKIHPYLLELLRNHTGTPVLSCHVGTQDWPAIIQEATCNGLTALLYRSLMKQPIDCGVPPHLLEELRGEYARLAASNLVLSKELKNILLAFREQALLCVPLRGLALAGQLYGDLLARPMGDIDLLVRKENHSEVTQIFHDLGYRMVDRLRGFALEFSYTFEFIKLESIPIIVEPHWTIAYPPFVERLDMEEVWRRCVPGELVGVETRLLCREDLVLNLCLHLAHHGASSPLLWRFELAQLLQKESAALDWEGLARTAIEAGIERLLVRELEGVKALFDFPVPDHILERLSHRHEKRPAFATKLVELSDSLGRESLAALFELKDLRKKCRYAWRLLLPSPEFMLAHYGLSRRSQLLLWYPKRTLLLCVMALKVATSAWHYRGRPSVRGKRLAG